MRIDNTALDVYRNMLGDEAEAFIAELIKTYIDSTTNLLDFAENAYQRNETKDFLRTVHTIKSSSASLGASTLSQIAADLEMMGRTGDISKARKKLDLLKAEYKIVSEELTNLLS